MRHRANQSLAPDAEYELRITATHRNGITAAATVAVATARFRTVSRAQHPLLFSFSCFLSPLILLVCNLGLYFFAVIAFSLFNRFTTYFRTFPVAFERQKEN